MLVAIDWSGRLDDRGRTTWMTVIEDGLFRRLENGRSRPELRDELIRLRGRSGQLVAGIDFAFGFPQWYATANGWACGRDIWRAAYRDGGSWLTSAAGPFWEAEPEHQDYLERYPAGYTCHYVRPGWKLPHRADRVTS